MIVRTPQTAALVSLVACAWLVGAGSAPAPATPGASRVPDTLGLWAGRSLGVDDRTRALLETDDVTLMEYRMGRDQPVWFAQVAGFGTRAAFHPPEICYVGSRFEILEREPITVLANGRRHRLMRLVVAQDGERFEAWYWFTAAGRTTPSYYRQQLWLVADAIRRASASGTLIRISTPLDDAGATRRRLLAFVTALTANT